MAYTDRIREDADDAITRAAIAHEIAPTDSQKLRELALAYAASPGHLDEALRTIEHAVELDQDDALNWAVLGTVQMAAGDALEAAMAAERALSIDENCVEGHLVLGEAAIRFKGWSQAERRFEHVLQLAPGTERALEGLRRIRSLKITNGTKHPSRVDRAEADQDAGDQPPAVPTGSDKAADGQPTLTDQSDNDVAQPKSLDDAPLEPAPFGRPSDRPPEGGEDQHTTADEGSGRFPPAVHAPSADVEALNRDVLDAVEQHIDAFNQRDIDAVLDGFTEDAVLRAGGDLTVGIDGLYELFSDVFTASDHAVLHIRSVVVQNGTAACELTEQIEVESDVYESEFVGLYTVHSGKIVRVRLYRDDPQQ